MAFTEDISVFFALEDFGIVGRFTGSAQRIAPFEFTQNVIFESPSTITDFGRFELHSTHPILFVEFNANIHALQEDDEVYIETVNLRTNLPDRFIISRPAQHDGTGIARIDVIPYSTQDRIGNRLPDPFGTEL